MTKLHPRSPFRTYWINDLSSGPLAGLASHRVSVVESQEYDYVIITEGSALADVEQPSITNAVEYHCPQITQRLGLEWSRCRFIEPPHGNPWLQPGEEGWFSTSLGHCYHVGDGRDREQ